MAEATNISWADCTFNPWVGCAYKSPGCLNCYAENLMDRRYHRVKWGKGEPRSRTKTWNDPVKWNKAAEAAGVRKKVFCASLADWLDEEVPREWRMDLFYLILSCPNLDWLMLTKRPENAREMLPRGWLNNPLPNLWFGVSAENQKYYDLRVSQMMQIPAAIRWVSYEPALGPIDGLGFWEDKIWHPDWLVIGGESDQMTPARPFEIEWAEQVIVKCRACGVAPFMKQVGSNPTYRGRPYITKDRAGADLDELPLSIQVREFPLAFPHAGPGDLAHGVSH